MPDGGQEGFDRLAGQGSSGAVAGRDGDDGREAGTHLRKRVQRGFCVEGIETGLDKNQVCSAVDECGHLFAVHFGHLVEGQRLGGFFVYGDLAGLHDGVAGVKYRFIQSVGLGTFLADADDFKLSVEAGIAEVEEKLDGADSDEYLALRLAERADWVPDFAKGVSFFESADYLVDFEDGDRYFANLELGMDVPMFQGLSLTVKGVVNYNNLPAEGKDRCDRQLLVQVGYNF